MPRTRGIVIIAELITQIIFVSLLRSCPPRIDSAICVARLVLDRNTRDGEAETSGSSPIVV